VTLLPEPPTVHAQPRDYVLAVAAVAAALALRYLLNPLLGQQGPYLILSLAIVVAAFGGGFGPAVFATVLSVSIGTYFFIARSAGLDGFLQLENLSRTVLFLVIGLSIGVIGGRLRTSRHALAQSVRHPSPRSSNPGPVWEAAWTRAPTMAKPAMSARAGWPDARH
jgi:K+-sensing histidine kinase KdpD